MLNKNILVIRITKSTKLSNNMNSEIRGISEINNNKEISNKLMITKQKNMSINMLIDSRIQC
jgi:hypothetical protein